SAQVNWVADTAGLFYLELKAENDLCFKDTVLVISIDQSFLQVIDTVEICDGDTALIFGQLRMNPGIYYDTLSTIVGCDSILGIDLHINQLFQQIIDTVEICDGDTALIFGQLQMNPGIYYDTLSTIVGCDSILGIDLSVAPLPLVSIETFALDTVCLLSGPITLVGSTPLGGIYSGPGISGSQFDPSMAGIGNHIISYSYTDSEGCSNSDSLVVTVLNCTGLDQYEQGLVLKAVPNPVRDILHVTLHNNAKGMVGTLTDVHGRLVWTLELNSNYLEISVESMEAGIYFLRVSNSVVKIVKQ
ncbi:MAG: T9SS type A sorting domain-containing protein, partial [Flavobacteriales bacterium]|nr:T9SS type A sorting domain-containing protein [Flavobacteriales bacterium]